MNFVLFFTFTFFFTFFFHFPLFFFSFLCLSSEVEKVPSGCLKRF